MKKNVGQVICLLERQRKLLPMKKLNKYHPSLLISKVAQESQDLTDLVRNEKPCTPPDFLISELSASFTTLPLLCAVQGHNGAR